MPSKRSSKPKVAPAVAPKEEPAIVSLLILRDGVFIADDVRKDKGEKAHVDRAVAKILIDNGHAKPL